MYNLNQGTGKTFYLQCHDSPGSVEVFKDLVYAALLQLLRLSCFLCLLRRGDFASNKLTSQIHQQSVAAVNVK